MHWPPPLKMETTMSDIGDYYEQKRLRAEELRKQLHELNMKLRTLAPRTPEFLLCLKQIAATATLLEQARYVGD